MVDILDSILEWERSIPIERTGEELLTVIHESSGARLELDRHSSEYK